MNHTTWMEVQVRASTILLFFELTKSTSELKLNGHEKVSALSHCLFHIHLPTMLKVQPFQPPDLMSM